MKNFQSTFGGCTAKRDTGLQKAERKNEKDKFGSTPFAVPINSPPEVKFDSKIGPLFWGYPNEKQD